MFDNMTEIEAAHVIVRELDQRFGHAGRGRVLEALARLLLVVAAPMRETPPQLDLETLLSEADKWVEDSGHWLKDDQYRGASALILNLATTLRRLAAAHPAGPAPDALPPECALHGTYHPGHPRCPSCVEAEPAVRTHAGPAPAYPKQIGDPSQDCGLPTTDYNGMPVCASCMQKWHDEQQPAGPARQET